MAQRARPDATTAKTRVLVVDDDRNLLSSLERGLSLAGYEVRVAASGTDALALLEDESFDVAVVDLVLPDTWGPQMAVLQTELQPGLKVIYISGHEEDAVLKASSNPSGGVTFLSKPFRLDDLIQLIRREVGTSVGKP